MTVRGEVSRLGVLVLQQIPESGHEVRFLIDGEDSLHPQQGSTGWDPDSILSLDRPLMPLGRPRRIAIYNCGCGISGCGNTTPEISRVEDTVVWRDFRTFTGVFTGPDSVEDEIERATIDRSWEASESLPWRVVRRLREQVASDLQWPGPQGWRLEWSTPDWEGGPSVILSFCRPELQQRLVEVGIRDDDPTEEARRIVRLLSETPPESWPVHVRSDRHRI
jgi:hypothetical protein